MKTLCILTAFKFQSDRFLISGTEGKCPRDLVKELVSQALHVFTVLKQQVSTHSDKVTLDIQVDKEVVDDCITHNRCPVTSTDTANLLSSNVQQ